MATLKKLEDIEAWQLARELSKDIYFKTSEGKFARDFDHKDQINRSSGSATDNIAEGYGRSGNREFSNFLTIALGSANETKSQLYRAFDKKYISESDFEILLAKADYVINKIKALAIYLNQSEMKGPKYIGRK